MLRSTYSVILQRDFNGFIMRIIYTARLYRDLNSLLFNIVYSFVETK